MKSVTSFGVAGALLSAAVHAVPLVDESYPYTGPAIPVGDWADPSVNGNGNGRAFPRLIEAPAVTPATSNPTNNVNVISLAYIPKGIVIHYQTPFGLGVAPSVKWGSSATNLTLTATGYSHTYDRTPPCSLAPVTQCSQFFHEIEIDGLIPSTQYYYRIQAANGTTASDIQSFTTARAAGDTQEFSAVILADMGYANAAGTHKQIQKAVDEGIAFAWHGGDISYADDWFSGILPCVDDSLWPVCYNGPSSRIPGNYAEDKEEYDTPVPADEVPDWGGPLGGDMSVIYESNWDLWQQWMSNITSKVPYMVMPGNHEASCTEFDGPGNVLQAYLNNGTSNSTTGGATNYGAELTYYSCPPSQRNFTAYQNRFNMAGQKNRGGVGNMWYSFDYGLVHFISLDGETDFANSSETSFAGRVTGNETNPTRKETFVTDSGPFGNVTDFKDTKTYEQYQWLIKDLKKVDRCKTPWIIAMSHRPMYSTQVQDYQAKIRAAFEDLLLKNNVDVYLAGHIHWYERMWPLGANGTVDKSSIKNNNTYLTNPGISMTHIVQGMAGNGESHVVLGQSLLGGVTPNVINAFTAVLDQEHYGFNKLRVINASAISFSFIQGSDGRTNDVLTLLKRASSTTSTCGIVTTATSSANQMGASVLASVGYAVSVALLFW